MSRARGLASWKPKAKTEALLDMVDEVLIEYVDYLPLTLRQLFYRLVAAHGYDKTEAAYERLGNVMNRARRSCRVPFEAIRDDGLTVRRPFSFDSVQNFWESMGGWAEEFRVDRLRGQPVSVELWVEAQGMLPQLAAAVDDLGVPAFSSGGFDSLTVKFDAASRMCGLTVPTVVLHVGDHDPSGVTIFDSAAGDIAALTADLGITHAPRFVRIAVTPEQIRRFSLPSAPPKATDKRRAWEGGETVQAEALPPDVLSAEVRQAVLAHLDVDRIAACIEQERDDRRFLLERISVAARSKP